MPHALRRVPGLATVLIGGLALAAASVWLAPLEVAGVAGVADALPRSARAPAEVHGLPLPRASRSLAPDYFASSRGFRDTVRFYRRAFLRLGAAVEAIPVEQRRDVTVARFLSRAPKSEWAAVHVVLANGRTTIYILAADR